MRKRLPQIVPGPIAPPLRFPRLLRFQRWTLQRLFDHVHMPQRLQAVLAGQAGDYLLPPAEVSLRSTIVRNSTLLPTKLRELAGGRVTK